MRVSDERLRFLNVTFFLYCLRGHKCWGEASKPNQSKSVALTPRILVMIHSALPHTVNLTVLLLVFGSFKCSTLSYLRTTTNRFTRYFRKVIKNARCHRDCCDSKCHCVCVPPLRALPFPLLLLQQHQLLLVLMPIATPAFTRATAARRRVTGASAVSD